MALEGSLQEVGLADILQLLSLGQKTGCLSVTDRSNFGYIYFEDGKVIYASVLNRPDRLGELLVRNDVISRDELSVAMKEQAERPGVRLGELLVEKGALNQDELHRWIQTQIEEAVYHLFTWEKGNFHFEPDQTPDQEGALLVSINADALLMEGARRVDELGLIEKKIPSLDLVFALERDPRGDEEVELTEDQEKLLGLIDGQRTVGEIVDQSGLVEFDVLKALFGLIQAGFVTQAGKKPSEGERESGEGTLQHHLKLGEAFYQSGMMEDATREFQRALELDGGNPQARLRMGMIALKAKKMEECLEHFDALPEGVEKSYGLLRNRALALEALGRYEEAIEALVDAEAVRPGDRDALLNRGIVQLKAGLADEAAETFKRYRKKCGKVTPPPIFYAYAVLASGMSGDLDGAAELGREGLAAFPEHGAILVNTGAVLERRGSMDAAEALFLRSVQSESPTPAQAHKNLGDRAFARGDRAGARAHYERAVKIAPRLGDDVYQRLGEIAHDDEDQDLALLLWQRALEINPENQEVRSRLESLGAAPGG